MPEEATQTVVPPAATTEPCEVCATNHTHPEQPAEAVSEGGYIQEGEHEARARLQADLMVIAKRVEDANPDVHRLLALNNSFIQQLDEVIFRINGRLTTLEIYVRNRLEQTMATKATPERAAADAIQKTTDQPPDTTTKN